MNSTKATEAIDRSIPIFMDTILESLLKMLKTIELPVVSQAFNVLCLKNPEVMPGVIIQEIIAGNATWTLLLFAELAWYIVENDAHLNHAYVFRGTEPLSSSTQLL